MTPGLLKGDPSHSLRMTLAFQGEILKQVQDDMAVVQDDREVVYIKGVKTKSRLRADTTDLCLMVIYIFPGNHSVCIN